ncbi:MAG TPA: hypothetical protein EYP20_04485 [Aigarchaeota archaeon]|nr:hypothetical protein [Aigarchaeota archaeon]
MNLKQGVIEIANSSEGVTLSVDSSVSIPIKQNGSTIETAPFKQKVVLNQQRALMMYLAAHGLDTLKLKQGTVEILSYMEGHLFRLRLTDYAEKQRTLYTLSSGALFEFLFSLKQAIGRSFRYFHLPNLTLEVGEDFLSVSTPEGHFTVQGSDYHRLRFFFSKIVEGSTFAFNLGGCMFGKNRLVIAGKTFSAVKEFPLLPGRKVNEIVYMLHVLMS